MAGGLSHHQAVINRTVTISLRFRSAVPPEQRLSSDPGGVGQEAVLVRLCGQMDG